MAICAVIDLATNQQINTIIAEVTDLPPDNCKLVEVIPGLVWDSVTSQFVEAPANIEVA